MAFPDLSTPTGPGAPGGCDALLTSAAARAGIANFASLPDLAQLQLAVANCLADGLAPVNYPVPTGPSAPGNCHSAMLSVAADRGITGLHNLPQLAQIQIVVANLLYAGITPTIPAPSGGGANGSTAAALLSAAARRGLQLQHLPPLAALQIASANLVAIVDTTPVLTAFVVTPETLTPTVGTEVAVTAQAKDQFGNNFPGVREVTWSETGGGTLTNPTSNTNAGGLASNILTVSETPDDQETVTASSAGKSGTSATIVTQPSGGDLNPLIQQFVDGDYDGALGNIRHFVDGEQPDPDNDEILLDATLATPAMPMGNVTPPDYGILDFADPTVAVQARSTTAMRKYLAIPKVGGGHLLYAVGDEASDFPCIVFESLDWYEGDPVDLEGVIDAAALTETATHYEVTPSTIVPTAGADYTTDVQFEDVGNNDVHRFGQLVTATYDAVSGSGGGSVDPATLYTDFYGACTFDNVAGDFPTDERTLVEDQDGIQGTGDTVEVQATNAEIAAVVKGAKFDLDNPFSITGVSIATGSWMLVITQGATGLPLVPTATGLSFGAPIVEQDMATSGLNYRAYLVECPSGFSDDVVLTAGGGVTRSAVVIELTPDAAADIVAVSDNTSSNENWTGSAPATFTINYNQAFSDVHNAGFGYAIGLDSFHSSPTRAGWSELSDENNVANTVTGASQWRPDPDTACGWTYTSAPGYVSGFVFELAAVPE